MPDATRSFQITRSQPHRQNRFSTGWIAADLKGSIAHPLDAKLSPLGNYGGPTKTMIPLASSPATKAGSVSLIPAGVTTDQRGLPRVVGGKVDIGAVEIQQAAPSLERPLPSA